eukprot:480319-Pyramimonas_sp.AAC.1
MSQSPVQTSTFPLLKHAMTYCFFPRSVRNKAHGAKRQCSLVSYRCALVYYECAPSQAWHFATSRSR